MKHGHVSQSSLGDLAGQIRSLEERFPHVSREDRFILWFQVAAVTADEAAASMSLTGTSRDKGIDAIHIDETAKTVFVTQVCSRRCLPSADTPGKTDENRLSAQVRECALTCHSIRNPSS